MLMLSCLSGAMLDRVRARLPDDVRQRVPADLRGPAGQLRRGRGGRQGLQVGAQGGLHTEGGAQLQANRRRIGESILQRTRRNSRSDRRAESDSLAYFIQQGATPRSPVSRLIG